MAHTADFFYLFRNSMASASEGKRSSLADEVYFYLGDTLLDEDFDQIGVLSANSHEADIYRDLAALPKARR